MTPTPTLILDGIWGRPARWRGLQRQLQQRYGPAEVYLYNCSGKVPFETLGAELAAKVRSFGCAVNLIGFSMGGLVVRSARLVDSVLPIRRAVFLNSPHRGSWLAYCLPLAGVRQMRPGSDFLCRLQNSAWDVPTMVVWNPIDQMVIPGTNTRWSIAQTETRCGLPIHIWPAWSRNIRRRIVDFIADEPDSRSAQNGNAKELKVA